jgi:diguanylate cyclase (GGDEF)-like protein
MWLTASIRRPRIEEELQLIGAALADRAPEVSARMRRHAAGLPESGGDIIALTAWTLAFSGRMSADGVVDEAVAVADPASCRHELRRGNPRRFDETIRQCLVWRETTSAIVRELVAETGASALALARGLELLQHHFDGVLMQSARELDRERALSDCRLEHLATHDSLTGLPNRARILQQIADLSAEAVRERWAFGLVFLDLDDFKVVNDTLGHRAGDELLQLAARRLRRVVRERDAIGRLGGDEFVVILRHTLSSESLEDSARRLLQALQEPFVLLGGRACLRVTASVGLASYPRLSADELLHRADAAMYRAKRAGKNCVRLAAATKSAPRNGDYAGNHEGSDEHRRSYRCSRR